MPNRILKESICTSAEIDDLTAAEEAFFYRLIVNCDDFGRFDGRPAIVKARCFPLRPTVSVASVGRYLDRLEEIGLLWRYEVEGLPYLQVTKWERHQQVRAKRSKFPAPDSNGNHLISDESNGNQVIAYVPVFENPIQSESESESESSDAPTALAVVTPAEDLCSLLASLIEANGIKRPTVTRRWREEADRLLRIDGYPEDEVRGVMSWATADPFWKSNILSMPKFREKYPQLKLASTRTNGSKPVPGLKTAQWAAELRREEEARRGA